MIRVVIWLIGMEWTSGSSENPKSGEWGFGNREGRHDLRYLGSSYGGWTWKGARKVGNSKSEKWGFGNRERRHNFWYLGSSCGG